MRKSQRHSHACIYTQTMCMNANGSVTRVLDTMEKKFCTEEDAWPHDRPAHKLACPVCRSPQTTGQTAGQCVENVMAVSMGLYDHVTFTCAQGSKLISGIQGNTNLPSPWLDFCRLHKTG